MLSRAVELDTLVRDHSARWHGYALDVYWALIDAVPIPERAIEGLRYELQCARSPITRARIQRALELAADTARGRSDGQ